MDILSKIKAQAEKVNDETVVSGRYDFDFGFGEGINAIMNGFIEYGQHTIVHRHIPNLEDGLKPVQQGTLWEAYESAPKNNLLAMKKSAKLSSDTMNEYHPHGDGSIYDAMVRLVDTNGSSKVDFYKMQGNAGSQYNSKGASAPRYTEVGLSEHALPMFDALDGIEFVESPATELKELPRVMPTRYPYAFVGIAQDGMATGVSTATAIYDVNDIADLIKHYLKTGKFNKILAPDFATGCYVVQNTKEFKKLMETGRGRLKLRGRSVIEKNMISLTHFPHGVKVETLVKEINDLNMKGVIAYNATDRKQKGVVKVKCPSQKVTQSVLINILAKTSFQKHVNFSSRFLFQGRLISAGLYDAIEKWVSWREQVLNVSLTKKLEAVKLDNRKYSALVGLLADVEAHKKFMGIYSDIDKPESEARNFLINFGISDEVALDFILSRTMRALRNGDKYISKYESLKAEQAEYEAKLANIKQVISADMDRMKVEWGFAKRRSEVTTQDYNFVDRSDVPKEVTVIVKDGLMSYVDGHNVNIVGSNYTTIECMSDQTIVTGLDNGDIVTTRVKSLNNGFPDTVGEPVATVSGIKNNILFSVLAEEDKTLYLYFKSGLLSFVTLDAYTRKTGINKIKKGYLPVQYLDEFVEWGYWTDEVKTRITLQVNQTDVAWMSWGDVSQPKSSKAVGRLVRVGYGATVITGERYEFEGAWFMSEEFHRPQLRRIPKGIRWSYKGFKQYLSMKDEVRNLSLAANNSDNLEDVLDEEEFQDQIVFTRPILNAIDEAGETETDTMLIDVT